MYRIFIHDDAKDDLKKLWRSDKMAAARIVTFLEELEGNQDLLDRLTQHDYGKNRTAIFHVSQWLEFWRKRNKDLWRLKIWDLENLGLKYRIVYAYVRGKKEYRVLAVVPRDSINYDDDKHPLTIRINAAYEDL